MATINTSSIELSADTIKNLKNSLEKTLSQTQKTVAMLTKTGSWTGDAANRTVEVVTSFATKYQQEYSEKLSQYVTFLRREAAEGYEETERANVRKADSI